MANRSIMRIMIDQKAKQNVEKVSAQRGMSQITLMSRLVSWFAELDEASQGAILGSYGEKIADDVRKLIVAQTTKMVAAKIKEESR